MKKLLKRVLPASVKEKVVNPFHWLEAFGANLQHGFPARKMYVIQVTGTNGKTTTVSYIASILKAAGYRVGVCSTAYYEIAGERIANDRNFTNTNPFDLHPILAQMRRARVTHLVLETTSIGLDQYRVWGIPCHAAVMTNLTQDHLDYHKSMEQYAAAKSKLFRRKPPLIALNRDDSWFDYFNQFPAGEQKITYGSHESADCRIATVKLHKDGSEVRLIIDGNTKLKFTTKLPGKFNVYNATAAAAITYLMGLNTKTITEGLATLDLVPGRLEPISGGQAFEVFVDYAHTPDALENVLSTLRHLTKNRLILVFGATGDRDKTKRPIMGEIAAKMADRVFVTDDETYTEDATKIRSMIMEGVRNAGGEAITEEVPDRYQAIEKAIKLARGNDIVLITGMGHEQYRIMNGKREPWSDAKVAREILSK